MGKNRNLFVNLESGVIGRINGTDESYAYIEVIHPKPSSYAMPKIQYDTTFFKLWRPAAPGDLQQFDAEFDLPTQAPEEWVSAVERPEA